MNKDISSSEFTIKDVKANFWNLVNMIDDFFLLPSKLFYLKTQSALDVTGESGDQALCHP